MIFMHKTSRFLTIAACAFLLPMAAQAQDAAKPMSPFADNMMPPQASAVQENPGTAPDSAMYPPMRLTPDKSELVRLKRKAASVLIGNEAHIQVLLDTPTRLVVIPRAPGATYFTILDDQGDIVMQRHVIVASPKEKYVRIRRSCASNAGRGCQETSIYYCPDMCHDVQIETNTNVRQTKTNLMPTGSTAYNFNDVDEQPHDNAAQPSNAPAPAANAPVPEGSTEDGQSM